MSRRTIHLICAVSALSIASAAHCESAPEKPLNLPLMELSSGLLEIANLFDANIVFRSKDVKGLMTRPLDMTASVDEAISCLLPKGLFIVQRAPSGAIVIIRSPPPKEPAKSVATTRDKIKKVPNDAPLALPIINVVGLRYALNQSIAHKTQQPNISDAVFSDDIGQLPDRNAAEAIRRLPGAISRIDQGEGRYAVLSGVDAPFHSYTLNGIPIPSPDREGRQVPLDLFESDFLDSIVIHKSATADMSGYAAGAQVDLHAATPRETDTSRFSISAGYFDSNGQSPVRTAFAISGPSKFSMDSSYALTSAYSQRRYRTDRFSPSGWNFDGSHWAPGESKLFNYDLERERFSLSGAWNTYFAQNWSFEAFGAFSTFTETELRNNAELNFRDAEQQFKSSNIVQFDQVIAERQARFEEKEKSIALGSLSFSRNSVDWELSGKAYGARGWLDEPNANWTFSTNDPLETVELDLSTPLFSRSAPETFYDAENFFFKVRRNKVEHGEEEILGLSLDLSRYGAFKSLDWEIKFGGRSDWISKNHNVDQTYLNAGSTPINLAHAALTQSTLSNFLDGRYRFGPSIDYQAAEHFLQTNPQESLFILDDRRSQRTSASEDLGINQLKTSSYAQLKLSGKRVSALLGLRGEHLSSDTVVKLLDETSSQLLISETEHNNTSFNLLPRITVLYSASEQFQFRLGYSEALAIPDYALIGGSGHIRIDDEGTKLVRLPNPELDPARLRSKNAELIWSPENKILASIYGYIDDFSSVPRLVTSPGPLANDTTQPVGLGAYTLRGAEIRLEYRENVHRMGIDEIGMSLASGFVDLETNDPASSLLTAPFRFPSETLNLEVFAASPKGDLRIAYHRTSAFLKSTSDSPETRIFFAPYARLDARASYNITEHITLFAEALNLSNEPLSEYTGQPQRIQGHEIYGRSYYLGARLVF